MSSSSTSTATELDLSAVRLIDHHAHPLRRDLAHLDAPAFRRFFSESSDPRMSEHLGTTIFFRRAIRDLATLLGCEPAEPAVLEARARREPAEHAQDCLSAANVAMLLLDTGFNASASTSPGEMAALAGVPAYQVLRIETYVEALVAGNTALDGLEEALRETVRGARDQGIVALKSIAAYRGGLHVEPRTKAEASAALEDLHAQLHSAGAIRLEDRRLLDYALLAALEEAAAPGLPVQFHVALGDDDADLRLANPLHLRPLLRDPRFRAVPIVLLHCYPYVREAGYLANLYANVYVDVSLAVPLTAAGSAERFGEALELAPSSKVLFGTDAHSIPELFYLGALHGRRALARCLHRLVAGDYVTPAEAGTIAHQILWQNASRLYGLGFSG